MSIKYFLLLFILSCCCKQNSAQENILEELIWKNEVPNKIIQPSSEAIENREIDRNEFGFNRAITFVSDPSITVFFAPKDNSRKIGVLVFPGGGYRRIVIDKEGYDVARWLNIQGITAIIVKYRTVPNDIKKHSLQELDIIKKTSLLDALEAVRIVQSRSNEWNIDIDKIGVLGFSAGGNLSALLCTNYSESSNPNLLNVKQFKEPLNFLGLVYPSLDEIYPDSELIKFPSTFIAIAKNDSTVSVKNAVFLEQALRKKNIQTEFYLSGSGGHGFGLGIKGGETALWKSLFVNWLTKILEQKQ